MSINNNKQVVAELFIKYLDGREFNKLSTLFKDPNVNTWWMLGNEEKFKHAGTKTVQDRINTMDQLAGFDSFSFIADKYIIGANDNQIVIEAHSRGVGYGDRLYTNNYVLIIETDSVGDKIISIREYLDNHQIEQFGFGFNNSSSNNHKI